MRWNWNWKAKSRAVVGVRKRKWSESNQNEISWYFTVWTFFERSYEKANLWALLLWLLKIFQIEKWEFGISPYFDHGLKRQEKCVHASMKKHHPFSHSHSTIPSKETNKAQLTRNRPSLYFSSRKMHAVRSSPLWT